MISWLTRKLFGMCCGDCRHYELCFRGHPESDKQNTLEHPSCSKFKEV